MNCECEHQHLYGSVPTNCPFFPSSSGLVTPPQTELRGMHLRHPCLFHFLPSTVIKNKVRRIETHLGRVKQGLVRVEEGLVRVEEDLQLLKVLNC
jgi:hypothetical protein